MQGRTRDRCRDELVVAPGAALLAVACLVAACHGRPAPDLPATIERGGALRQAEAWAPPADWATLPAHEFEALVLTQLPEEEQTPFPAATYAALAEALGRMDATSVRAAVLLGRSRTDAAADVLLQRLNKRQLGPDRNSDAGDVVAAAALARFPEPERFWRILRLVLGDAPHPDLEVRVELACTALHCGFDRVIPFLLQVLRIGTWEGQADERDFAVADTTAWARGRAATALSIRAGVPRTYHPDAPIAMRERAARQLAELLAEAAASASLVDPRLMVN